MKKGLIVFLIISSLLVTGCNSEKKQKEEFDKLATDYYETYMTGVTGISAVEITLDMLNTVAEKRGYEIKHLKDCELSTKVTYTLEKNKIAEKEFELFCD